MKNSKKPKTLEAAADASLFTESVLSDFIHQWGKIFLYSLLGLAAIIFIFFQFTRTSETNQLKDYLQADAIYQKFLSASPDERDGALKSLSDLLARHPDLKQKYEGKVAQALIGMDRIDSAKPYLGKMGADSLPLYRQYSETTLSIAQGKYQKAYEEARALQERIQKTYEHPEDNMIFAFNLLRLAVLQGKLGLGAEEQKTWQEILTYSEEGAAVKEMMDHIQGGRLSLKNYIEHRTSG